MSYVLSHPCARSGLAAVSDLRSVEWRELFSTLEREQLRFLEHEPLFRSAEYTWPRDPLHEWSRCWEYPYTYYHLRGFAQVLSTGRRPIAVDVGCGVTFLPYALASLGYDVICADTDPICGRDIAKATKLVPHAPGNVSFRGIMRQELPIAEGEADVVVCISVLEHIPDCVATVREIARILAPGGLLVLTMDIDLENDRGNGLGVESYRKVLVELLRYFELAYPEVTVHPADVLRSSNSIFPAQDVGSLLNPWFLIKQKLLKPLIGRRSGPIVEIGLVVQAFVMRRLK